VVKGVVDAGITCPHDEAMLPGKDRIMGKHIKDEIPAMVEEIKNEIIGGT
jgi:hypothetical protein